jgi:type I restriction enzyme S subunit
LYVVPILFNCKREIEKIQLIRPPKQEQQKIADILTTWDNAINQQTTLIEKKQQLKKGLMQQLLTAKTRFSEFSDDWEIVKIKVLIFELLNIFI